MIICRKMIFLSKNLLTRYGYLLYGTITGDFDPVIDDVVYNLKMTYDPSLIDKSEEESKDWSGSSQKD